MPYAGTYHKRKMCPTGHLSLGAHQGQKAAMSANRISFYRKLRKLSQTELAERIGTTLNMLGKLERGERTLDTDWLTKIGNALEIEPHQLLSSAPLSELPVPQSHTDADIVSVQKLDLSLSMGPGTLIDGYVEAEPVSFDLNFIRAITRTPPDKLKLVTGIGDSMYPTLNWGDAIMVDTNDRQLARQDGIYWIDLYGAAGLKRLRAVGRGRVLVISDNRDVPEQEVDAQDLRIEGRAIWVARGL